jgi:hypothetical protein
MNPRALALVSLLIAACTQNNNANSNAVNSVPVNNLPGHDTVGQDNTDKEGPRMVPPEAYVRTYLQLFGGLSPLDLQARLRGSSGSALFDTWADYLASLGFPDYRSEMPRVTQTNTLMLATFERIGVALCDRAMEHDHPATSPPPADQRLIYAFDLPTTNTLDVNGFAQRFDVLHRTFLGYPAAMAPTDRIERFYQLYTDTVARHANPDSGHYALNPVQAGWASVCYGLVRHPEFHLY